MNEEYKNGSYFLSENTSGNNEEIHFVKTPEESAESIGGEALKKNILESNKGACGCFGFEEEGTEKWAVKYMKVWDRAFTLLYLIFGSLTFAPVLFLSVKLKPLVKRGWLSVAISALIYLAVALSPIWIKLLTNIGEVS